MNNLFMLDVISWLSYIRVIVGGLGLAYFLWFYFKWKSSVRNMSTLSFYTLSKSVKKGRFMWVGLFFLTLSFSVDLIAEPTINAIFGISLFQTLGIIIIGYAFYEYLRSDLRRTGRRNVEKVEIKGLKEKITEREEIEKKVMDIYDKVSEEIKKPKKQHRSIKRRKAKRTGDAKTKSRKKRKTVKKRKYKGVKQRK